MSSSSGKLDSLKHLLDGLGTSEAASGEKAISWVHSPACERRIRNASLKTNQDFCCTCVYRKLTPLLLKTLEETMINENEGGDHEEFKPRLKDQARALKAAEFLGFLSNMVWGNSKSQNQKG